MEVDGNIFYRPSSQTSPPLWVGVDGSHDFYYYSGTGQFLDYVEAFGWQINGGFFDPNLDSSYVPDSAAWSAAKDLTSSVLPGTDYGPSFCGARMPRSP